MNLPLYGMTNRIRRESTDQSIMLPLLTFSFSKVGGGSVIFVRQTFCQNVGQLFRVLGRRWPNPRATNLAAPVDKAARSYLEQVHYDQRP